MRALSTLLLSSRNPYYISTGTRLFTSNAVAQSTIIHIPRANVYRFGDANKARPVFKDLEWTVKEGENWAVVGPAGSEKTNILEVRRRAIACQIILLDGF